VLNEVIGSLLTGRPRWPPAAMRCTGRWSRWSSTGVTSVTSRPSWAAILAGPVFVTTPDGRVVAQAGPPDEVDRVLASPAFDRFGRFKVEGEADDSDRRAVVPIVAGRV